MAARARGPRLSMRAPRGRPGEFLRATLIVDSDRALIADALEVVLRGHERIRIDDQQAEHALPPIPAVVSSDDGVEAPTFVRMVLELTPRTIVPGKLPAGRTSYECHFQLPIDLPPSYRGRHFEVGYAIHARLDVAWGADATGAWHLEIGAPPRPGPSTPLHAALPRAPAAPLLELQLDTTTWSPGASVTGALQLSAAQPDDHAVIDLTLIGSETTVHTPATDVVREHLGRRDVGPTSTSFELHVPRVPPSFHGQSGALSWRLELRFVIATSLVALPHRVLDVPLIVDEEPPRADRHAPLPSPVLTDDVVEATWQRVAQRFGLVALGTRMTGTTHGCALSLRREPGRRPSLTGELRFHPLRIDLRASPEHPVSDDERASPQVRALFGQLRASLPPRAQTWFGDDHARFVRDDSGRHEGRLDGFVAELVRVAAALEIARAELPLPEVAGLDLLGWDALGRELETPVERGDLSIRPLLRGLPVVVTPRASTHAELPAGLHASITTPFQLDVRRQPPHASIQIHTHGVLLDLRHLDESAATVARHIRDLANLAHDLRLSASPYR